MPPSANHGRRAVRAAAATAARPIAGRPGFVGVSQTGLTEA
jgi:hypothetical protein